jgi:hypothetical protein
MRRTTGCVEDDVGVDVPFIGARTVDAVAIVQESGHYHFVPNINAVGSKRRLPEDPLEGCAPAAEQDEIVVPFLRRRIVDRVREEIAPSKLGGAGAKEIVADVREPVSEKVSQPREKSM